MENEEEQKLREQFQEWYRTTSDVGSKPTADWWLSKLKEAKIKQIEEIRTKLVARYEVIRNEDEAETKEWKNTVNIGIALALGALPTETKSHE